MSRRAGEGHPRNASAAPDRARPRRNRRRSDEAWRVPSPDYLDILRSRGRVLAIIRDELNEIKTEFATPRLTELVEAEVEVEDEDLIEREDVAVTVTHAGYIKRTPLAEYRVQGRGGKGRSGMATREEDFVTHIFVASTHAPLVFFSSTGMAYKLKVWRLPEAPIQGRGKAMVNLLPLQEGERITTILPLPERRSRVGKAQRRLRHQIRRRAPQRAVRFRQHQPQRQDRHEARGRRRHRRRADLHGPRRHPADHAIRQMHPLRDQRRARLQGPRLHRRARHQAGRRRRGGEPVAAASFRCDDRRSARLSQAGECCAPRGTSAKRASAGRRGRRRRGDRWRGGDADLRALRRAGRASEQFVLGDLRKRFRQAHEFLSNIASRAAAARASSPWIWAARTAPSSRPFRSKTPTISC